ADLRKTLLAEQERIGARKMILEKELMGLFEEWDRLQDQSSPKTNEQQEKQRQSLLQQMKELLSARAYLRTVLQDMDEGLCDHYPPR
ncbi:MAG TPA: hypothetical protein VIL61_01540, partial [Nitrospiria bacterium]